ncbi:MAG: radical SAM protein [Thermoprotei archaeon]|nr:MAG: radical SAM protein [Thermoprotei archaeon]
MTNHHGRVFLGFLTTSPAIGIPERLWMWICAPKPKVDKEGRPLEAPYGLRKIEAALLDAGFKAAIIDPDYLDKHLKTAKALLIGHHDFFAFCAPSNTWWAVTKKEPVNRKYFIKLMESKPVRQFKKRGGKIVVGGPAVWQWLFVEDLWEKWGVDTIIDGEGEKVVVEIAERILEGKPLPKIIYVSPRDAPSIEEIPTIKGASVNGLVEIMRGCPRGCKFSSVTLRPLRFIPLEKILEEVRTNIRFGVNHIILHSEDVLLYGANGIRPREAPLLKLHEAIISEGVKSMGWAHVSLAAVVYAQRNGRIISKLTELIYSKMDQNDLGVQTGIETGSPRLARLIMPAKAAPYKPEEWPDIVEEAFSILADNNILPAATIILNIPEETPDDVAKTAELIDRLKDYPSLIVPMYFVPLGVLKNKKELLNFRIKAEHIEVMWKCLEHSLRWAPKLIDTYLSRNPLVRIGLKAFLEIVKLKKRSLESKVKQIIKEAAKGQYEHVVSSNTS